MITKQRPKYVPKDVWKEILHLRKTKVPRCLLCKEDYVHAVDSKTKKISKYLWKPVCECVKGIMVSMG